VSPVGYLWISCWLLEKREPYHRGSGGGNGRRALRIAAIDIGSNSVHMVVVDANARGGFRLLDREKEMVRLGARSLRRGRLTRHAMARALETLRRYRRIADSHDVEKLIAVATSAVREAENGDAFLARVGREVRIWPRVLAGGQEARLTHRAVMHSVNVGDAPVLVVDIGGGSVELALSRGADVEWVASEKIGVLRLTEGFVRSDPLAPQDEARLVRKIKERLSPHLERARPASPRVIGTSGTTLALGALAQQTATGLPSDALHHLSIGAAAISDVRRRLCALSLEERLRLAALDAARADLAVAGAVLLDEILRGLGAGEITLCEWALREGVVLDYVQSHKRSLARAATCPDPRRRSVTQLAERCAHDDRHARHTARLALALFDGTRPRHGLGAAERELLEYAALLHDIGHHISYPAHHKHSYYLIKHGDLHGFEPAEIETVACVARYHRRGRPRKTHAGYGGLQKPERRAVRLLAGLLRLADALDRSHGQAVQGVEVRERNGVVWVRCQARADCEVELWRATRRAGLLSRALGCPVRVARSAASAPKVLRIIR
jgi:exopolyphosphatase/guanosine-5'-triphosphate,3'-diphosphate pyrophosphatase